MKRETAKPGDTNMAKANLLGPSALSLFGRVLIMGGAGLLVLVGLVLQLGALGYGHFQPSNIWIVSTILERAWSMLSAQLDALGVQWLVTFWPVLLISIGLAVLIVTRGESGQRVLSPSQGGQNHGQ
jgi:hypothetical protein